MSTATPGTTLDRKPAHRVRNRLLIAAATAVLLGFGSFAYLFLGTDPSTVSITDAVTAGQFGVEVTGQPRALDGDWRVDTQTVNYDFTSSGGSFLGFRIAEELSNVGQTYAVGRTAAVGGSVTIDGTTLSAGSVTGDNTVLTTDKNPRDRLARLAMGKQGTFVLTKMVGLTQPSALGVSDTVKATGDLTINGVTRSVTIPLTYAFARPELLVVTGSLEIDVADYDVKKPTARIVLSLADTATVELQLFLSPM